MGYFKYLESKWLDGMLKRGSLKIGTLNEYRKSEAAEIGDENEGKGTGYSNVFQGIYSSSSEMPGLIGHAIKLFDSTDITLKDVGVSSEMEFPDTYIYSLTKTPSKKVMEHFGYDACVEILDMGKFAGEMAIQLFNEGRIKRKNSLLHECFYINERTFEIKNQKDYLKLCWLKDPKFAHQDEFRIVFEPSALPNGSMYVDFPKIIDCLKIHVFD
jgi:hypothetical protein